MTDADSPHNPLRALLLVNRDSRSGAANAEFATETLRGSGVDVVFEDVADPQTTKQAIESHARDVELIIVGGGDGTVSMTAEALIEADLPVAILPLGTANDLARTLHIPTNLRAACKNAIEGITHSIDVGQCNDVHFVNVASLGMPVRASETRSDVAKRWFGPIGYAANVTSAFRNTRPFHADLSWDGQTRHIKSIQLVIGNGRNFGGGLVVAPDASVDDGDLDVYSLEPQSAWRMLAKVPALIRGPDNSVQGVQLFQTPALRLTTGKPMSINTDGEVLTQTPAEFRLLRRALRVKVPQSYLDSRQTRKSGS